mmetsp:Transcript_55912/g.120980  ORF Transcript_55912/g.120980 Transcript_55912/m.120980 type:complete len:143 (-) Transcript_55912:279-707(-)
MSVDAAVRSGSNGVSNENAVALRTVNAMPGSPGPLRPLAANHSHVQVYLGPELPPAPRPPNRLPRCSSNGDNGDSRSWKVSLRNGTVGCSSSDEENPSSPVVPQGGGFAAVLSLAATDHGESSDDVGLWDLRSQFYTCCVLR